MEAAQRIRLIRIIEKMEKNPTFSNKLAMRTMLLVYEANGDKKNKIFATARGYGELKGWWEFPGGKVEPGETPKQALVREIMEELDTEIKVGELIDTIEFDYPTFHLSMDCFWAEVTKGHLELKEAEAAKWLRKDQLDSVAWLPADVTLIRCRFCTASITRETYGWLLQMLR